MLENWSSAAVVIGALMVDILFMLNLKKPITSTAENIFLFRAIYCDG